MTRRLQEQYAQEFAVFKPDKKLRWLPHLGTVHLELQLEDWVIDIDVPPLEAAFIELFSSKRVGSVDRSAALKALLTWVDLGVLKEDIEGTFRLLEVTEEPSAGPSEHARNGRFLITRQNIRCENFNGIHLHIQTDISAIVVLHIFI
ncbi:hypothetical protein BDZ94DRAFT_1176426 [Collybia nuda]|uniref:Cullin family profile domain-containing protein n=1 Tax=Collybia nuda TaxID=64659 RepID=A0A9P5XUN6_9AGAR|nr:hypothetical protein BDZ94DRAFT_1176426 [Collybia nuda]